MAELSTIARPYAQAVFDVARVKRQYGEWSAQLQLVASIVSNADVLALIGNTSVRKDQVADLVIGIAADKLSATGRNLVHVLADNRRLGALVEIARQFEELRAAAEATQDAEVVSAFEIDSAQQQAIASALQKRLGRKVNLVCKIDPSLLGGAVIRAGDLVIDGSALGRLNKLTTRLAQ
jgi:F-type H+-transporting ATPase subunit delta